MSQTITLKPPVTVTVDGSGDLVVSGGPPSPPLQVSFSYTPSQPYVGGDTVFTAKVSGGVPPYTFSWYFSGAESQTGPTVTHQYGTVGGHTVTLAVTDSML